MAVVVEQNHLTVDFGETVSCRIVEEEYYC